MEKTKEQKALDEELFRECMGYSERDNKPDGAYIEVEERYKVQIFIGKKFFNLNKIKRLITSGADVNAKTKYGQTPLHKAVYGDTIEAAKLLIASGADVNAKDLDSRTPLHLADNVELAKLLIDSGADVRAKNEDGDTPLHRAVYRDNTELAKYLIEAGSNVNSKTGSGKTPLHLAKSRTMKALFRKALFRKKEPNQLRKFYLSLYE